MKSKLDLPKYYCIPSSRDNAFSFELSEMIAKRYRFECLENRKNNKKLSQKILRLTKANY